MKISMKDLQDKLNRLDERLIGIWLDDQDDEREYLSDDEKWEIFVVLLESRVELLKVCKESGIRLSQELYCPQWLEKLVTRQKEIRLRELRLVAEQLKNRKVIQAFEKVSADGSI